MTDQYFRIQVTLAYKKQGAIIGLVSVKKTGMIFLHTGGKS